VNSPLWRGAALCAVVALLVPSALPDAGTLALRIQNLFARALSPPHALAAAHLPSFGFELPRRPEAAPDAYERTLAILHGEAHPALDGHTEAVARAIADLSGRYDMEPELILAVIHTESSFRPAARSRRGAIGLMQLLPRTARPLAAEVGIPWRGAQTLCDPVANVRLGTHYLSQLRERFDGDLQLAVSAYNLGPARVKRYLGKGKRPEWYAGKVESRRVLYVERGLGPAPADRAARAASEQAPGA